MVLSRATNAFAHCSVFLDLNPGVNISEEPVTEPILVFKDDIYITQLMSEIEEPPCPPVFV